MLEQTNNFSNFLMIFGVVTANCLNGQLLDILKFTDESYNAESNYDKS